MPLDAADLLDIETLLSEADRFVPSFRARPATLSHFDRDALRSIRRRSGNTHSRHAALFGLSGGWDGPLLAAYHRHRARDRSRCGGDMSESWIPLSDPDITTAELRAVTEVMQSPELSGGPTVAAFEAAFAAYTGRRYAIAVASGTIGLLLALRASGIGPGDEVIASPFSWRETAHAIAQVGATVAMADIDYWSGVLLPEKAAARITPRTRCIIAGNPNGHPAPWSELRELATEHGLLLIEDSTEAIGSVYQGTPSAASATVRSSISRSPAHSFAAKAAWWSPTTRTSRTRLRRHRARRPDERTSVRHRHDPADAGRNERPGRRSGSRAIEPHRRNTGEAQTG